MVMPQQVILVMIPVIMTVMIVMMKTQIQLTIQKMKLMLNLFKPIWLLYLGKLFNPN